jgi:hypothetical protein
MAVLRQRGRKTLFGLLCAGALASVCAAGDKPPSEYEVKAACLYNFAKFVEWPKDRFAEPDTPIVIGVYGVDPFGRILDDTVKGRTVNERPIVVKRIDRLGDLGKSHILFVSRSENQRLVQLLGKRAIEGVLTVGESDEFIRRGGVINFKIKEGKVRFQVNQQAAERAGLKISSQMLRLSIEIEPAERAEAK